MSNEINQRMSVRCAECKVNNLTIFDSVSALNMTILPISSILAFLVRCPSCGSPLLEIVIEPTGMQEKVQVVDSRSRLL